MKSPPIDFNGKIPQSWEAVDGTNSTLAFSPPELSE